MGAGVVKGLSPDVRLPVGEMGQPDRPAVRPFDSYLFSSGDGEKYFPRDGKLLSGCSVWKGTMRSESDAVPEIDQALVALPIIVLMFALAAMGCELLGVLLMTDPDGSSNAIERGMDRAPLIA